jgi:hypothetical protein
VPYVIEQSFFAPAAHLLTDSSFRTARLGFSLDIGELLSGDKPAKTMGATDSQVPGTAAQTGMHMLLEGAIISVIIAAGTYMYLFLNEIGHSTSSMALFELELKPLLSAPQPLEAHGLIS